MNRQFEQSPNATGGNESGNTALATTSVSVKRVNSSRGVEWLLEGFRLFWGRAGLWIGSVLIWLIISMILTLVPVLGNIIVIALMPIFIAGFMMGAYAHDHSERFVFEDIFAGFKHKNKAQLLLLGVLSLSLMVLLILVVGMMFASVFALIGWEIVSFYSNPIALLGVVTQLMMPLLVATLLLVPITMLLWFSPALTILQGCSAVDAMKLSFKGCLINTGPFLIYSLLLLVLSMVAAIPLGLGYLVLVPVTITSVYVAYRDIYTNT